jgi:hypothetical protein
MPVKKLLSRLSHLRGARSGRRQDQSVVAPVLSGAIRFPYGPFHFKTQLPKGVPYSILTSTDLLTWHPIAQDTSRLESIDYLDSEAHKFSHRFYRVLADEVFSTNVIGYASILLPPGFSLIANPLDSPSNSLSALFAGWPDATTLNKFDTRLFRLDANAVQMGKWTHPAETLSPGEGAVFFNPTSDYKSHSFVGTVTLGNLSIPIPAGFSMRSSLVPQPGHLVDDLKFPIAEGDVIHLFDRDGQKYLVHPFEDGKWPAGPPILGVGEAFWVAKTEPGNWTRTLSLPGQ